MTFKETIGRSSRIVAARQPVRTDIGEQGDMMRVARSLIIDRDEQLEVEARLRRTDPVYA